MNLPGVIVSVFIVPRPAKGGGDTWGPAWLGGPGILVKHLVMGATVKRVGGP